MIYTYMYPSIVIAVCYAPFLATHRLRQLKALANKQLQQLQATCDEKQVAITQQESTLKQLMTNVDQYEKRRDMLMDQVERLKGQNEQFRLEVQ